MTYLNELVTHLKQYEGKTVDELCSEFNISASSKQKNFSLAQHLIGTYEGLGVGKAKIKHFKINLKTIQLKANGKPQEAMSFPMIDFMKIVTEDWDTSELKNYLLNDFLFFVFQEVGPNQNILKSIFRWNVPEKDLEGEIKEVWEDTKSKVQSGNIIRKIEGNKVYTTFKREAETNVCHVRPHASSGRDLEPIPVTDKLTGYNQVLKQSFWFNHSYIIYILDVNKEGQLIYD